MKIKIKDDCKRHFLMCGRIFIKKGEIKEYSNCLELKELFKRNLIEEVKEEKEEKVKEKPKNIKKQIEIFERKFDKKAIWRGKKTKAFLKWIDEMDLDI